MPSGDPGRVLVTGGAGFLGSHIVDALLARGAQVVVLDHRLRGKGLSEQALRRVEAIEGDIRNADTVREAARDCALVFHCAALVGVANYSDHPTLMMETEEAGLRNVCVAVRGNSSARVVYASSAAVYGRPNGTAALDEDQPVYPASNYGVAKRFGELYLAGQFSEYGLRSVALRIFNIYGPAQDSRLVIPRFIAQALDNVPVEIYGSGEQTRDFVYVTDVVTAALRSAEWTNGFEVVNACSGRETSVRRVAETVVRLTKSSAGIVSHPMPENRTSFEIDRSFGSRAKSERVLGAAPATSLDEGLRLTIESTLGAATPARNQGKS